MRRIKFKVVQEMRIEKQRRFYLLKMEKNEELKDAFDVGLLNDFKKKYSFYVISNEMASFESNNRRKDYALKDLEKELNEIFI